MNVQDSSTSQLPMSESCLAAWVRIGKVELPPRKLMALLELFGNDPEALICAGHYQLREVGLTIQQSERVATCAKLDVQRDVASLMHLDAKVVTLRDSIYPYGLRQLPDAPPLLYVRGALQPDDQFSVAIVGSRRATSYGLSIAERFARELSAQGLCVVSGGARGIDTYAHRGALAGRGRTIAVIGCGLDINYPAENRALYDEIVDNRQGAVISEYPLGATPEPWRFPARNRLISGITLGTLVIESPVDSGAMITAHDAAEQGREVFAVPGPIETGHSSGCHRLIKEGAKLVECAEDIIEELGLLRLIADDDAPIRTPLLPAAQNIEPDQRRILDLLSLQARHVDQLADGSGMPASQVVGILTMLELHGLARRVPGNAFVRVL